MVPLHPHAHQWALVGGARQPHSDLVVCATFSRRNDHVFVVVDAVGDAVHGHAACVLVAHTITAALHEDSGGSVTTAVRRACAAAHAALCAHNNAAPLEQRALVGVSCAVMHQAALYVAQVQPAHAWVQHNGDVRALPMLDNPLPVMAAHALGGAAYTTPEFVDVPLVAGDTLVLCSQTIARSVDRERAAALLQANDGVRVADVLANVCVTARTPAGHALVVEWRPALQPIVRGPIHATRIPGDATRAPHVLAHEQALPTGTIVVQAERPGRAPRRTHATLPSDEQRTQGASSRTSPERATSPRGTNGSSKKRLPPRGGPRHRRQGPVRLLVALLVACVVALVTLGVQQIQQRPLRVALAAIAEVDRSVGVAERARAPLAAQQALAAAQATLHSDVEPLVQTGVITTGMPTVWNEYTSAVQRYEQAQRTINRVAFVDDLRTIATLGQVDGLVNRVVVGTPTYSGAAPPVFFVDRSTGRVWEAGKPTPVLQHGDVVDDVPVARLREALWRDDKLLMLERGDGTAPVYRLLYQDGKQWIATMLARSDTMAPVSGDLPIATYGGNLYVWDRDTQQVWQYTAGQLSAPPVPTIGDVGGMTFHNVVDIAVDERTYLLNSDGSIVVLHNGQVVQHWGVPQLATPISTVARFVVTPSWTNTDGVHQPGAIYLLDTQHERVVQLDATTGSVVQQIQARRPGMLNQLTDLAIDERNHMLYLANGTDVLRTPIPLPPQFTTPAPAEPAK